MFAPIRQSKTSDKEQIHINVAYIKKSSKYFEIVVDPDKAVDFKSGKIDDVHDVLMSQHIFQDAKKGRPSPKTDLGIVFGKLSEIEIAEFILRNGALQLSAKYREEKLKAKRREILDIIQRNAINPDNNLPHPLKRLENAFEEAKIRIDEKKSAEDQVQDALKKLKPILPIRFETKKVEVHLSKQHALKHYKLIHTYGKVLSSSWLDDGCYLAVMEVPAGVYADMIDDLNKKTHGGVEIKVINKK